MVSSSPISSRVLLPLNNLVSRLPPTSLPSSQNVAVCVAEGGMKQVDLSSISFLKILSWSCSRDPRAARLTTGSQREKGGPCLVCGQCINPSPIAQVFLSSKEPLLS